jgi:hypothetical protein
MTEHVVTAGSFNTLEVIFDNDLIFNNHISQQCKSCLFHLRSLRHIRPCLTLDSVAKSVGVAIVQSRLDYNRCSYIRNPHPQPTFLSLFSRQLHRRVSTCSLIRSTSPPSAQNSHITGGRTVTIRAWISHTLFTGDILHTSHTCAAHRIYVRL